MNSRDRLFWTEFLQLYRSLPAVWKVKSPEYSSRALKTAAYEQLAEKLREVEPHADRALVVKKINSFRTNFRRDLRKREHSTEEEPFESTLWYFELLGFLEGQEGQEGSLRKRTVSGSELEAPLEALHDLTYPKKRRRLVVKDELPESPAPSIANSPLDKLSSSLSASKALAHTWRCQFDELSSKQKLLARKLISDVLFYGCMEQLEPCHVSQLQQMMLHATPPLTNKLDPNDSSDADMETSSHHSQTLKLLPPDT